MVEVVSHAPIQSASASITSILHTVFSPKLWLAVIGVTLLVAIGVTIFLLLKKRKEELQVFQKYFDDMIKSCKVSVNPAFYKARWNPLSLLLLIIPAGSILLFLSLFKYIAFVNAYAARLGVPFLGALAMFISAGLFLFLLPIGTAVLIPLLKSKKPVDVYLRTGAKLGTFGGVLTQPDKIFLFVQKKILGIPYDKMLILFPKRIKADGRPVLIQNWEKIHSGDIRLMCAGVERKREEGYYVPVGHAYYTADLTPFIMKEFKDIRDDVMWTTLLDKDSKAIADAIELNPALAFNRRMPSKINTEEGGGGEEVEYK